jgi:hypothetical protein
MQELRDEKTSKLRIGILDRSSGHIGTVQIASIPMTRTEFEAKPAKPAQSHSEAN